MPFNPTPRPSKTETLLDLYNNINANPATGIRSHLVNKSLTTRAWGEGKQAGSPLYMSTNRYQDTQYNRAFQPSEFKVFTGQPGSFNQFSLNYAKNTYNHDNSRYYG